MDKKQRVVSRREFLAGASALAAGGLLAACAPAEKPAPAAPAKEEEAAPQPTAVPAAKEPITIQYWVFWGQPADCEEPWRATDEWKEMESGIGEIVFKTGMGGEAGLTAVASGTPPDIGDLGPNLDFMIRGVLVPIDDLVSSSTVISPEKFLEGSWAQLQWQGVQYGVPAHECYGRVGLCYNVRMVEEAGLDPDNPPVTWPELLDWHEKLTKFDEAGNLLQIGLDPFDAMGSRDGVIPVSWGFDWFDPETEGFHLEEMAEGLESHAEFVRIIGPDNLAGMRSVEGQGTWGGSYNAEVQAMIIEGYWHPGETAHEKPEVSEVTRATWSPVPEERRGVKYQSLVWGHGVVLFKDAPHPLEAWPIAEWLQSDACLDILLETIGWLPGLKSYINKVTEDCKAHPEDYPPGLEFYLRSAEEATEWAGIGGDMCPVRTFVRNKMMELSEQVYRDEISAAEAAKKLEQLAEQEYQEAGFA